MSSPSAPVALLYDDDAYVELTSAGRRVASDRAIGLMGRQVAGKEFLDAYLTHGQWAELVVLVLTRAATASLKRLWEEHPAAGASGRCMRAVPLSVFQRTFFPVSPAPVLHFPNPPDPRFVWARQHGGPGAFAVSGVTHTLCSRGVVQGLCELVTAPFESFDSLICTSRAVEQMVRAVTSSYADYLRERHGGNPGLRLRLARIPLGVNPDRFHPASPEERAAARQKFGIGAGEVAVLFVGRLSFHAKAHPYPIYAGLARACRATGKKVHLLLAGWAANAEILKAFQDGASVFAPGVRVSVLDGSRPDIRFAVWHAADVVTSLVDNLQETFGLTVLEGMASGLPVVASDWDGYKDLVADGENGYLIRTYMVRDAAGYATARLIVGEVSYDDFLAECSQTVAVDVEDAAGAYARLIADEPLRRRLGEAGRKRVLEHFTWATVVRAYDTLWREQDAERRAWQCSAHAPRERAHAEREHYTGRSGPACYPAPETSFPTYPTTTLSEHDRLIADEHVRVQLDWLLRMPLTNYAAGSRSNQPAVLKAVLDRAAETVTLAELDAVFAKRQIDRATGRATVAWMLKYALLRVVKC